MLEMRPIIPEEFTAWLRAESRAHGNRHDDDPEGDLDVEDVLQRQGARVEDDRQEHRDITEQEEAGGDGGRTREVRRRL